MLLKLEDMCKENDVFMELKVPNAYFHRLAGFFGRPIEVKRHNFRDLPYFETCRGHSRHRFTRTSEVEK